MKTPAPYVVIVYRGGCRPRSYDCITRDAIRGLVAECGKIDKGAIWEQRSRHASKFLEEAPHQWMCFIDGDHMWRPDLLPTLGHIVMQTRGICGAVVSKDSFGCELATAPPEGRVTGIGDGSTRYVNVQHGIGSPMAIHRDALRKIVQNLDNFNEVESDTCPIRRVHQPTTGENHWSFFYPMLVSIGGASSATYGAPLYEHRHDDTAFIDRAHAAGVTVSVALGPRVLHFGEMGFGPETAFRDDLKDLNLQG